MPSHSSSLPSSLDYRREPIIPATCILGLNQLKRKTKFFKTLVQNLYENNGTGSNFKSVESLNEEFLSSILHLLPLIYVVFTCVDPYSEYGSGSTKLRNLNPNLQHCAILGFIIYIEQVYLKV